LGPGPGFFPFWLSLLGAALTLAILVETVRSHELATGSILPSRQAAWQVGGVLIALAAAAALLEPLGFLLTMLLFIGARNTKSISPTPTPRPRNTPSGRRAVRSGDRIEMLFAAVQASRGTDEPIHDRSYLAARHTTAAL
jgi:Tripartite tricarboxylate transporter TctB family